MPNHEIRLLPILLANQIAAGEVVERPASVVKELLENSIDAKSTKITIDIEQGGQKRICIRDNGIGIAKEQLTLAFARHATSKILTLEDLNDLHSKGFRGEALASISSVSRCSLISKPADQDSAWKVFAEGSNMQMNLEPAAHPLGTSVEVLDLFFNTPARRRFLRAPKTEFLHIENTVRRISLAHPEISFELTHNDKAVLKYKSTKHSTRIKQVIKASIFDDFIPVNFSFDDIEVNGWVTAPGGGLDNNECQYTFINQRMMKDRLLMHAVRQAYEGMLADAKLPGVILFLSMSPDRFDVNVHPAKHEVRFHEARTVHDCVYQAINTALTEFWTRHPNQSDVQVSRPAEPVLDVNHDYIRPLTNASEAATAYSSKNAISSRANFKVEDYTKSLGQQYQNLMRVMPVQEAKVISLGKYCIVKFNEQVYLQQVAKIVEARIIFVLTQDENSLVQQPLLMPVTAPNIKIGNEMFESLTALGFEINQRQNKLVLLQVPAPLRQLPWIGLFVPMLESLHKWPDKPIHKTLAELWCTQQAPDDTLLALWVKDHHSEELSCLNGAVEIEESSLASLL